MTSHKLLFGEPVMYNIYLCDECTLPSEANKSRKVQSTTNMKVH